MQVEVQPSTVRHRPAARVSGPRWLKRTGVLVPLLVAMVMTLSGLSPYFLTAENLLNALLAVAAMGIIAVPMTMVLVSGGIDISVGAVAALSGVVTALAVERAGAWMAMAAGLLVGGAIGLVNGTLIEKAKMNAVIVTLATMSIARGLAFVLTGGLTVPVVDPLFWGIGLGTVLGVPIPVIPFFLIVVAGWVIMARTVFGRSLYAVGANKVASRLAGLRVERVAMWAYVLSGLAAGLSGILLTAQLAAGAPQAAAGLEFSVIAAVVLGGTSLSGGSGTITGTTLGVLLLGVLSSGFLMLNVSSYYQDVARGLVLLLAVALDQLGHRGDEV